MDVTVQKPDGTITYVSGTPEEIKDFFGVTYLPKSSDDTYGLEPGVYVVADGWTPSYLTTGKYYPVCGDSGYGCSISDDTGDYLQICYEGSTHLNGGNWRKVVVE